MGERIKANINIILNIITTLIILSTLAIGYGQTRGKIVELENIQTSLDKRQDRHEACLDDMQDDVKKILCKVSVIEGRLIRDK